MVTKELVYIERGTDGTFGAYMDTTRYDFGLLGTGNTVQEAVMDFKASYEELKELYAGKRKAVAEI